MYPDKNKYFDFFIFSTSQGCLLTMAFYITGLANGRVFFQSARYRYLQRTIRIL